MKDEINTVLNHLECEGILAVLRNQLLSLSASRPHEVQQTITNLLDAIRQTNIQSHKDTGYYYLFLGCLYLEQDDYKNAILKLQSAANEMWGAQVNKALAHWLLGVCYSNAQEFPKARNELQEALQMLAAHMGVYSPRTERERKSRQTMQQNIKDAYARLFNGTIFRDVRPDPAQSANRFPVQDPQTDEKDAFPISITNENYPAIHVPVTITNENNPVNKVSFSPSSPDAPLKKVEREKNENKETDKNYETRTDDDDGHLVIRSVPVYEGYARAGQKDEPEPVINESLFAEYHQVTIEDKNYVVHSLRSNSRRINVIKEDIWGWIKVKGKSMNAMKGGISIEDGDYVLFKETFNADDNDIVIAVHNENYSAHVKRLKKSKTMLYSETSEKGSEYAPMNIEESGMEITGIVYAVAKPTTS